jgi:hypothetical protein
MFKHKNPATIRRPARHIRSKGGRPRKFAEPSRPVTVTLPDTTLALLAMIDSDRARAIAKAAQLAGGATHAESVDVEVRNAGSGRALIIVQPNRYLRQLDCISLLEIAPGRSLISIPPGTPSSIIEVGLRDLLDAVPASEIRERAMLEKLAAIFRRSRQSNAMSKEEILIIPYVD